jgi:hypothetical protein
MVPCQLEEFQEGEWKGNRSLAWIHERSERARWWGGEVVSGEVEALGFFLAGEAEGMTPSASSPEESLCLLSSNLSPSQGGPKRARIQEFYTLPAQEASRPRHKKADRLHSLLT